MRGLASHSYTGQRFDLFRVLEMFDLMCVVAKPPASARLEMGKGLHYGTWFCLSSATFSETPHPSNGAALEGGLGGPSPLRGASPLGGLPP